MALQRRRLAREQREDWRAGVLAATLVNVNGGLRGKRAAKPEDFFPSLRPRPRRMTPAETSAYLRQLAAAVGGTIGRLDD